MSETERPVPERDIHDTQMPSMWVTRWIDFLNPHGEALDLACGYGRHARYLAGHGHRVLAVDRDEGALQSLKGFAAVTPLRVDLEGGEWPMEAARFDAVVVTNYLHRPLLPRLAEALKPGGVLLYETFMIGNERHGRPSNPDFLLRPGELLEVFSPTLQIVAFEEGETKHPKPAVVQRLCALRPPSERLALI